MTTETEVEQYIKNKMGWPDEFCRHMAEKFWNHYEASGWRLSNGNKIKSWQACFNSQWQFLRFKEDRELLEKLKAKPVIQLKVVDKMTEVEQLDQLLAQYKAKFESVSFETFGKWYDYMKANKLLKEFSKQDIEIIKQSYPNDNFKCRCAVVKDTFSFFVSARYTFTEYIQLRSKFKTA